MFWAVPGNNPDWLNPLSGSEVRQAVDEHIAYMTSHTKGQLAHWDVNNELVHGRFFEQKTGDPHYTQHMFEAVHQADPTPTLFLNEYNVVAQGEVTQSYLSQVQQFKAANVGLGGVGVQSHFYDAEPNPDVLQSRLDYLASAGLPIWITELDMPVHSDDVRADRLEKVLRLYFSHPAVKGIILWGFWGPQDQSPDRALVNGYGFELNAAGKRWMKLIYDTWSTHVNTSLAASTSFDVRGFKGDYEAVVWYKGNPIQRSTFSLGDSDKTLNIDVAGDGQTISLPTATASPFHTLSDPAIPYTSQDNLRDIGSAHSTSSSDQLQCISRASQWSEVGDDKMVGVSCQGDEVLTGCSSVAMDNGWFRDGEQIVMENGKPTCRAINGYRSSKGVQAVARCCSMKSLSCTYRNAGPSGVGMDDQVVVPCGGSSYPTGCSTWTYNSNSDGTAWGNSSCISQNDDPSSGVYAYAACCQGNGLQCMGVSSSASGQRQNDRASVSCPPGYLMTGCNVFSQYGKAAGAFIPDVKPHICYGVNGADKHGLEVGVVAHASCCKLQN